MLNLWWTIQVKNSISLDPPPVFPIQRVHKNCLIIKLNRYKVTELNVVRDRHEIPKIQLIVTFQHRFNIVNLWL